MPNWNLILDFETFGQSVIRAAVINCAYVPFDWDRFATRPYTYDELLSQVNLLKLDVKKQVDDGYIVERSSITDFWSKMPKEVQKQIQPSKDDLTYSIFCDRFMNDIDNYKINHWWSRSNTFDPILLWRIFEDSGKIDKLQNKLKFWRVRDIRTYIDAVSDFKLDRNAFIPIDKTEWDAKFREHDARHDIVGDVLRLQRLNQIIED